MKNLLFILAIAGTVTLGCSTNQKNDAADADSNRIDTTRNGESAENVNAGAMADTLGVDTMKNR